MHDGGLRVRSRQAERMETDCADYEDYARCLADLTKVNVVTMTHRPIVAWLARESRGLERLSVCDIGCGQGDLLRLIARRMQGRELSLEGVDRHPWSIRAARAATPESMPIVYREADLFDLPDDCRWDFIISSQFAHHLTDEELIRFIRWQERHALRGWFIADLHRHWFAYYGFPLLARAAFWHQFVRKDGQVSIARAFTVAEWRAILAEAGIARGRATVSWHFPFRICVARCKPH